MNKVFRIIWSQSRQCFVVAQENAKARGKSSVSSKRGVVGALSLILGSTLFSLLPLSAAVAAALPAGGHIVAGSGHIKQSGTTLTVTQNSAKLAANWHSFNIGKDSTVNFVQPSARAVALNRVVGADVSVIQGALNANGQVFLVNPNGVLFTPAAQVNVGGLVASTLNIRTADFMAGKYSFQGDSDNAIINQGTIHAAKGGTIALIAAKITNTGQLTANSGNVLLGAGRIVTLDLGGPVKIQVKQGAIDALIQQGGAIQANGGLVYLTAQAAGDLASTVINQTGIIEAHTLATGKNGEIYLRGDMHNGRINIGGTLDASAPNGGNGGFIDTSAAQVSIADSAQVTTVAPQGNSGQWLIDPFDFTIAASGGNISGTTLSTNLGSGNVTIASTSGSTGTAGDVNVNDTVTWSAHTLTLNAQNNLNINAAMNGSGTAKLALEYGQGAVAASNTSVYNVRAPVNLPAGSNFSTKLGSNGTVTSYTVITSLGVAADATTAPTTMTLQGMAASTSLGGNYVLGANISAGGTSTWNTNAGFVPIGNSTTKFSGTFDGLGHSIINLMINRSRQAYTGLFGYVSASSHIRNVGLLGGSITGNGAYTGGLVGYNSGTITNSYATGAAASANVSLGGLVGRNSGTIINSYATGAVSGSNYVGGLVGENHGTAINSYATGAVTGTAGAGGLVGLNYGTISSSYATGAVRGTNNGTGGLVGQNHGPAINSYATGAVTGADLTGGLVGVNATASPISNSYATGVVTGTNNDTGGLVGQNYGTISTSYATGAVSGASFVGGLVGSNISSSTISTSYATGAVSGSNYVGGLVGYNAGTISTSYWNTTTTGQTASAGSPTSAGLTTAQMMNVNKFTGFTFTTTPGLSGNNWVIVDADGTLNGTNGATYPMLSSEYSTTISNAHQLQLMDMALGASYRVGVNIDASNTLNHKEVWGTVGFVPIGNSTTKFSGTFDGLGHSIINLMINRSRQAYTGLFGYVSASSHIRNVGLLGGGITGNGAYTGSLVGYNSGTIINSYATGAVNGASGSIGGLVGNNQGTISNSYATGAVNGASGSIGGLVGNNQGTISNSYATGAVNGASGSIGGLVGNNQGMISSSYWNKTTTGQTTSAGGTGLTTAQMQQQSNFTGFDFTNNWVIYNGHTDPLLRAFMTPLTVTANASKTYDGLAYSGTPSVVYSLVGATPQGVLAYTGSGATGTNINAGSYTIIPSGLYSTQQQGGYIINFVTSALTINKASISAVTGITAKNKVYDGLKSATLVTSGAGFTGLLSGDMLNVASATGTFATKDVGTGKTVSITGITLGGSSAGNYTLSTTTASTTANITLAGTTTRVAGVINANGSNSVASGGAKSTLNPKLDNAIKMVQREANIVNNSDRVNQTIRREPAPTIQTASFSGSLPSTLPVSNEGLVLVKLKNTPLVKDHKRLNALALASVSGQSVLPVARIFVVEGGIKLPAATQGILQNNSQNHRREIK